MALGVLPVELIYRILYNLKGIDVLNLLSVNKRLYAMSKDEKLWLDKLEYDYPNHTRYRFEEATPRDKYIYFSKVSLDKQLIISLVTVISLNSETFSSVDVIDRFIFIPGGFLLTVSHDYTRLFFISKTRKNYFEEKYINECIPYAGLYSDDDKHSISKTYDSYVDIDATINFDGIELGALKSNLQRIKHDEFLTDGLNEVCRQLDTLSY